jgi:glucokinase
VRHEEIDMGRTIGITTAEEIATGLVEGHELIGKLRIYEQGPEDQPLLSLPPDGIAQRFAEEIKAVAAGQTVDAIGVGLPGIINCGFIEESPNLRQLKGAHMQDLLAAALRNCDITAPVYVYNDADVLAAGLAAAHGNLDRSIRVWTLGHGVGFGIYPRREGVWEGGHVVVSLDPRERYCGCGGEGHLEGIMGHRAMRLRFLDMEPEEIFEHAKTGDARCKEFVRLWHRGLAAATANSIHMQGPGRFYYTGLNVRFLDMKLLQHYLQQMVTMSPLQNYTLEIVPMSDDLAVTGAAIAASQAAKT